MNLEKQGLSEMKADTSGHVAWFFLMKFQQRQIDDWLGRNEVQMVTGFLSGMIKKKSILELHSSGRTF